MIVRSIDADGDWNFGKGLNNYLSGNAAVAQLIETNLRSFLGDCFFAVNDGIDWFNLLGNKNQLAIELAVRARILNTEGVIQLNFANVSLDPRTRILTMSYSVNTIYTNNANPNTVITTTLTFLTTEDGDVLTTEDGSALISG